MSLAVCAHFDCTWMVQQFNKYDNSHILTVTITLKITNNFFCMLLKLMMMHHHFMFAWKRFTRLDDTVPTNIHLKFSAFSVTLNLVFSPFQLYEPSLWPWPWRLYVLCTILRLVIIHHRFKFGHKRLNHSGDIVRNRTRTHQRSQSTFGLSPTIRSLATGNQSSRPMKSRILCFVWYPFCPLH